MAVRRREEMATAWPFLGSVALVGAVERGSQRTEGWLPIYGTTLNDSRDGSEADFIALVFTSRSCVNLIGSSATEFPSSNRRARRNGTE
jgi:hypothetical protein